MTKSVLITGANGKMGQAIAKKFLDNDYFTILNYHVNSNRIKNLENQDLNVASYKADIRKADEVKKMVDTFSKDYDIDVLVNNAGITRDKTLIKMSEEEWDDVLQTNLYGAFNVTKAVLPTMKKREKGSIVNIASVVGINGGFGQSNYAASKAGLIGFTKSLAKEVAKYNINVNAIAPGYIDTDMTASIPGPVLDSILSKVPMGKLGKPEDIAKIIYDLTESDYITGEVINVNGGFL